jgi:hypothetical protein
MSSGQVALHLKQRLVVRDEKSNTDTELPLSMLCPGAVGVLVVFDSPQAAREALGSQVKLLEVRWPVNNNLGG